MIPAILVLAVLPFGSSLFGVPMVIADLQMPGSSGMDLLNHLLQLPRRPVAMIATGYPSLDTALRGIGGA
jgi:CheY-like chemotaxis protein